MVNLSKDFRKKLGMRFVLRLKSSLSSESFRAIGFLFHRLFQQFDSNKLRCQFNNQPLISSDFRNFVLNKINENKIRRAIFGFQFIQLQVLLQFSGHK